MVCLVVLWPLVGWGHDGRGGSRWSASYRRSLSDEAFAVIEVTANGRTLRRLPHHDHTGQLDIPHLRSALGRLAQVTWIDPRNAEIAKRHLEGHLRDYRRAVLGRKLQLSLPLHLNTASVDELARLPHLGQRRAARIIAHRDTHGPFASIDQLARVPGMGKIPLHRIRDFLTTE